MKDSDLMVCGIREIEERLALGLAVAQSFRFTEWNREEGPSTVGPDSPFPPMGISQPGGADSGNRELL